MNYALIRENDIANGPGVRTSLFVSGCRHHCKGCFNPETWNFSYGTLYTDETTNQILDLSDHSFVTGLTLLGGEPFEPENQAELAILARKFKQRFPEKTIWCYSGYSFEDDLLPKAVSFLRRSTFWLTDGLLRSLRIPLFCSGDLPTRI